MGSFVSFYPAIVYKEALCCIADKNEGVFCARNKGGKDVSFRAFLDYGSVLRDYANPDGLFQKTVSGSTQYHWSYLKDFQTYSAVSYEYTEMSKLSQPTDQPTLFSHKNAVINNIHTIQTYNNKQYDHFYR